MRSRKAGGRPPLSNKSSEAVALALEVRIEIREGLGPKIL